MKFFSKLTTLAVFALSFVAADEDKVEAGKPCVKRCPANLALLSADLLINDLCTIVNNAQLFSLQTAITNEAVWATNFCGVENSAPLLQTYLSLPGLNCLGLSGLSSYVTSKGSVITTGVFASSLGDSSFRVIFTPDENVTCKYLVSDIYVSALGCP